jgi:hypothetical protein
MLRAGRSDLSLLPVMWDTNESYLVRWLTDWSTTSTESILFAPLDEVSTTRDRQHGTRRKTYGEMPLRASLAADIFNTTPLIRELETPSFWLSRCCILESPSPSVVKWYWDNLCWWIFRSECMLDCRFL